MAFHDCAAVYFHKNDILDILKDWPEPNGLLKSVLFDIKAKVFLAGARAMGIFDKLVTAPFWKLLENKGSILDLYDHLLQMKVSLMQWSNDGSEPFSGLQMFSQNVIDIDKDELYYELFKETNDPQLDSFTQIALELLSAQFLIILERQASTQLPGDVYWTPSQYTEEMTSNVLKTNTISERDMAILDNFLKVKPSARPITLATILMWSRNKPSDWLSTQSENDKSEILNRAQKLAPKYLEVFQDRQRQIQAQITQKLEDKKAKKERQRKQN